MIFFIPCNVLRIFEIFFIFSEVKTIDDSNKIATAIAIATVMLRFASLLFTLAAGPTSISQKLRFRFLFFLFKRDGCKADNNCASERD